MLLKLYAIFLPQKIKDVVASYSPSYSSKHSCVLRGLLHVPQTYNHLYFQERHHRTYFFPNRWTEHLVSKPWFLKISQDLAGVTFGVSTKFTTFLPLLVVGIRRDRYSRITLSYMTGERRWTFPHNLSFLTFMWHMTCDIWHMTQEMWHMTYDMCPVTHRE